MVLSQQPAQASHVFKVDCEDGSRYIVYNAAVLGNPSDHVPNKWYARPYPVVVPLGLGVGEPFDTPEAAERAARSHLTARSG